MPSVPGQKNIKARSNADNLIMRDWKKLQLIEAMKNKVRNGN